MKCLIRVEENMSIGTWLFRKRCIKADSARDANNKTPDTVERFDNIQYGLDEKYQLLDVYRPKGMNGMLPVIVSVHGGGWVYGDKDVYQYYCMSLARRGFIVVNFTYRLAPKHKHPAQLEDTNLVFEWLLAHAAQYSIDTDKIFAVGDSAGATILGLYTAILTNSQYAKQYRENNHFRLGDKSSIWQLIDYMQEMDAYVQIIAQDLSNHM